MSLAPDLPREAELPPKRAAAGPDRPMSAIGALLLRIHFYAGVLVAPFLVVAALTGLAYTTVPQLDAVLYGDRLHVESTGGPALPLADQIAAARAAHPDGTLSSVITPPSDGHATRVVFSLPELGEKVHTVYVDPYTGAAQGQLTTWFGSTPAATWLDDLHRNLHLGVVGRHYSELAASWLWVIALGGLVLWLRRARGRRLVVQDLRTRKGVRRTRGWHATTGVWLLLGLLILSATGLTWSRYAGGNFSAALDALDAGRPAVSTSLDGAAASGGGHHGGATGATADVDNTEADRVLRAARDAGLSGPVEIALPADAASAWTVTQVDERWPVRADAVAVDAGTDRIIDRENFADWSVPAKLSKLGVQAHMGVLFGPVNQILLAALAVGLLCVVVWGYRMWWQRRPTRAGRRALVGAPPARGAWQRVPTWLIVVGVPVVLAVGWAMPVLGVSLLAFLVADRIAGAVRSRRAQPIPTSPPPAGS
jgi:uncharacterized iron-regulated membrane protein